VKNSYLQAKPQYWKQIIYDISATGYIHSW
jgi:hypothetical protein